MASLRRATGSLRAQRLAFCGGVRLRRDGLAWRGGARHPPGVSDGVPIGGRSRSPTVIERRSCNLPPAVNLNASPEIRPLPREHAVGPAEFPPSRRTERFVPAEIPPPFLKSR